jgi:hypothetical protein
MKGDYPGPGGNVPFMGVSTDPKSGMFDVYLANRFVITSPKKKVRFSYLENSYNGAVQR